MDFLDGPAAAAGSNEGTPVVANPHVDPNNNDEVFGAPVSNNNNNNNNNNTSNNNNNNNANNNLAAAVTDLPTRADIKTQDQLMADSIAIIEARGQAKFDALQAQIRQRTADQDGKAHDSVLKMEADAAAEIKAHIAARDSAVAAAKKTHAEAQKTLLSEMDSLEKKGSTWELAASHCELSKPNSRATKSTDKMRKTLATLVTEPNVPLGVGSN